MLNTESAENTYAVGMYAGMYKDVISCAESWMKTKMELFDANELCQSAPSSIYAEKASAARLEYEKSRQDFLDVLGFSKLIYGAHWDAEDLDHALGNVYSSVIYAAIAALTDVSFGEFVSQEVAAAQTYSHLVSKNSSGGKTVEVAGLAFEI